MTNALDPITVRSSHYGAAATTSHGRGPYRKVIVPIGDNIDPVVAQLAGAVADRFEARLEVLAVVSPGLEDLDEMQIRCEVAALGRSMELRLVADDGDVPGALLAASDEEHSLICLGTRGASALGDVVFGSVGTEIIRRSRRELLVVGPRCARGLIGDKLVIALDGSTGASAIMPSALELAKALALRPQLVEVLSNTAASGALRRALLAQLSEVVRTSEGADIDAERTLVHGSRVGETLVAMSRQSDIAMLAMSTHGLGRFERLVGGGITFDVIRRAHCPVLVGPRLES